MSARRETSEPGTFGRCQQCGRAVMLHPSGFWAHYMPPPWAHSGWPLPGVLDTVPEAGT